MQQRYSLAKISQELGVSKAAVSLSLSGKARQVGVSEELEKRILDFCRKIDYQPNIHARRLNSKLVKNIGLLLERFEEGATALMLSGVVEAADRAGFRVTIQIYRPEQPESIALAWLRNREIDGMIFYGLALPEPWRQRLISENWPAVGIGIEPGSGIPSVNVNNFTATYTLAGGLVRQGFREFHFFGGLRSSYPARERERGFRTALREAGVLLPEDRIHIIGFSKEHAQEVTFELLSDGKLRPGSAIVCASDLLAIGAMQALHRSGFQVPQDFHVTGVNGSSAAADFAPSLTTFEYLPRQQGILAAEMLLERLANRKPPEDRELKGRLIPGESAPVGN
ncbi:MAG: LacI family DNA-binding transcriptional regulator [Lentisphaeria bacterium]|nr:LacI family DNA-binding transcriptional regulator [Lentisphaeria bacterium]